nr:MAG TPA: hypothetical protein [Caudoviricetes sp.]
MRDHHIHSLLFSKFLRMAQPCGLQTMLHLQTPYNDHTNLFK